ncbi:MULTISPECIES: hypothetical protein [Bifidobacterium]|uniref:Uncharacterized protein n=1 Tax=Bifidobacterium stellenboschense TaxID=762211 RepID=A0A087DNF3_9BIFI|nr:MULTISPECIES: hypothetical protein [Bifidobacterium]KFI97053.1 hypothetical protein BSTEL_1964 [Bifidobacterium stellenboschense]MBW3081589.1 hypothetical protein [Bifidobacterium saguinibicoloris]
MNNKQPIIFAVLATVVVDVIMLVIPHANVLSFWLAFVMLTLSGLAFLIPALVRPATDYTTRLPAFVALGANYVLQIVLTFFSNTGWWRVTLIVELLALLAVSGIALAVSYTERRNDAANAYYAQDSANRFTPKQGGF